ncbi:uncharacterized protein LOC120841246 [Ixodes scapularis]|uniref:uncharacterized protein LOC120841246 n=1 Tax=Ixodes scapularis TaxID=6945 RepID=UPI001A9DC537|nr:uncharacterized protein LOC120841246 [Ixodes scapularis]
MGCPQGSPLSPLLWNILLSGLLERTFPNHIYLQAFADDIVVVIEGNSRRELEERTIEILQEIGQWTSERKLYLNYSKCKCLIITRGELYEKRPPIIKFHDHKLEIVKQLKILGVIYDSHLTFLPHLQYIKQKVQIHTANISKIYSTNWGITSSQLREIYLRSIERYIVYGSPAWWRPSGNSHMLRQLQSIQRLPLLKIARAFRTVSNISLPVLCNIIPINITLDVESFMFNVFQLKIPAQFDSFSISPTEVSYPIDLWKTHPTKRFNISFQRINSGNAEFISPVLIYTDGSVYLDQVGAAFVILKNNGRIIKIGKYRLPKHSTIFDAEAIAIFKALDYILATRDGLHCNIYTDSLSVLQALANPNNAIPLINEIKHIIQSVNRFNTTAFFHVKSHTNILGNDLADQFANSARYHGQYIHLPKSKQNIKHTIMELARRRWDHSWQNDGKNTELFKWIPSTNHIPISFPPSRRHTSRIPGIQGIIELSESEYAAPTIVADQPHHRTTLRRMVHNYRELNAKTVNPSYPMPIMEDLVRENVTFLGYEISLDGRTLDQARVAAVGKFRPHVNAKKLYSILQFANRYRMFILIFSARTRILRNLIARETPFVWTHDHQDGVSTPKHALKHLPIFASFQPDCPTCAHVDVCQTGLGTIRSQLQNGKERGIEYASRWLNKHDTNLHSNLLECMALY